MPRLVILQADPLGYAVVVQPALPSGDDCRQTFVMKNDAWGYARAIASSNRLGFRDETAVEEGKSRPRGPYRKRLRV